MSDAERDASGRAVAAISDGADSGADGALGSFHPAVRAWFGQRFERPTAPQREGWPAIRSGRHTLISAPTGSGKTLAAFLVALDDLLREGLGPDGLPDLTRVVYVSPLKALSADVHRNLSEPRRGIAEAARGMGLAPPEITSAVRSGDTPRSRRRQMVRTPPQILVTTPESLYLYLTARKSRETLRSVRTVIVDEIHAVLESRRGSHLALSLERLRDVTEESLQRVGLSATQHPIDEVARFLVGTENVEAAEGDADGGRPDCHVVDRGHEQEHDLALEIPGSPLEAVVTGDVRQEVADRVAALIGDHRTTLVFVNTRREAERVAHGLSERLGEEAVTAHHGSLSKERRKEAERRLKEGRLDALVATASMELGIDIGYVDLVCQLGTPNRIATFVQRVGRSGHTVDGTPRGRLFPLTRDELVQGTALLRAVRSGELDRVEILESPLDVLSQQVVAEVACGERDEEEMFRLCRRAWPYRGLAREEFDEVVRTAARGFDTRRGRRGARIHRDAVNGVLKPRKGARLAALTCGGAIPDNADYRVVREPDGTYLGTVNEDFAIESLPGDVFQLGNTSWRLLRVETGVVRVEDAGGEPPNIPFWLGEAPARSDELSASVSELRREVGERLGPVGGASAGEGPDAEHAGDGTGNGTGPGAAGDGAGPPTDGLDRDAARRWLVEESGIGAAAARQVVEYLAESKRLLGVLPTEDTLVLERFFDEAGGMQLVLHAPFGSRVNRAWGLALRKRFCRQFNFELQAAATEEGVLLSLGPQHSFPLDDVFRYLKPETVREVLVQAVLDAPMFQTRWRWCTTLSLAQLRWRGGSKVPPQIQRMEAEDLLSAVFPDANACLENVAGEREVPDHPLVRQTLRDCLTDAMDLPRLTGILERLLDDGFELVARDTPEPSPLSHELVSARPYAYLDDAEAEERRTLAVRTRRAMEPSAARELGALDPDAVRRVREEARPEPRDADELHDALLTCVVLPADEALAVDAGRWRAWLEELAGDGRAGVVTVPRPGDGAQARDDDASETTWDPGREGAEARFWVAAERLPEVRAVWPEAAVEPGIDPPEAAPAPDTRAEAITELVRGRLEVCGPTTARRLSGRLALPESDVERGLLALEDEGTVLRGHFTPSAADADEPPTEWCHRRLLARIHRLTLERLRAEVSPVSARDFVRFLFRWQRAAPGRRLEGREGVAAAVEQLEGFEVPAAALEADVLAARVDGYDPADLDALCTSGRAAWGRLTPPSGDGSGLRSSGPLRTSPVALWGRPNTRRWLSAAPSPDDVELGAQARRVLSVLQERGASFFPELVEAAGLLPTRVEQALGELVAFGLATADSFSGLRALMLPSDERRPLGGAGGGRRGGSSPWGVETAGRWSLLRAAAEGRDADAAPAAEDGAPGGGAGAREERLAFHARVLLRRWGVVFRALLEREPHAPPWRELLRVLWRLEARGEVRGGRFVSGFAGEQFALPEAVGALRGARGGDDGELVVVSAADPLNLTGVVTRGERIPARPSNRIGFRDGLPVCALAGGEVRNLEGSGGVAADEERALVTRRVPPELRACVKSG